MPARSPRILLEQLAVLGDEPTNGVEDLLIVRLSLREPLPRRPDEYAGSVQTMGTWVHTGFNQACLPPTFRLFGRLSYS